MRQKEEFKSETEEYNVFTEVSVLSQGSYYLTIISEYS